MSESKAQMPYEEKERPMEGNQTKMREVLVAVKKSIDGIGASALDGDPEILMMSLTQVCARLSSRIEAVLSEPARNCDVGTAEEQEKRFDKFCDDHDCKSDCPLFKVDSCCEFAWAQMPYEEKGAVNG